MAEKRGGFYLGCLTAFTLIIIALGVLLAGSYVFKETIVRNYTKQLKPPALAHGLETDYDWPVASIAGEPLDTETLEDRPVFLHVWSPRCIPCLAELPGIEALRTRLADAGVAFLVVAGVDPGQAQEAAANYGYEGTVYKTTGALPAPFDTANVPMTYIIAPGGKVVHVERGSAQWDIGQAAEFLRALAAQTPAGPDDNTP